MTESRASTFAADDATGRLVVTGPSGGAIPISGGSAVSTSTATRSNVAGSASSVTVLASNAARLGATVYNDSSAILYLELGSAAASTTNYTVQLAANAYYEIPYGFTGQLTGIWASATGNARVTELSA